MPNKIFIICGSSGSGKGSVIQALVGQKDLKLRWARTLTTRPKRADDNQLSRRTFITKDKFERLWQDKKIVERNEYNGNYYGVPVSEIARKGNVLLDIDIHGAMSIKKIYGPRATAIFLRATTKELRQRLRERGMNDTVIDTRLKIARQEQKLGQKCDFIVHNRQGQLDQAIQKVTSIIKGVLEDA
jgi:guanylate kinase